jgi:WD40 repeat protein
VTFAPDGHTLIAAGWDGTIRVWDTSGPDPQVLWTSRGEKALTCLAIAPDGRTLAVGEWSGWLRCWDRFTGQPLSALEGDGSSVRCVAYSPDGRTLAAGSYRGRIRLWDAMTHRERPGPDVANLSSIVCMAYAPDGRCLATGHDDRVVRLWDPETGKLLRALEGHQSAVRSLGFTPDGRELASGSSDATIVLWDMARAMPPKAGGMPTPSLEAIPVKQFLDRVRFSRPDWGPDRAWGRGHAAASAVPRRHLARLGESEWKTSGAPTVPHRAGLWLWAAGYCCSAVWVR